MTATTTQPSVRVALGDGSRGFGAPATPAGTDTVVMGRAIAAGAIDGNASPDFAIVNEAGTVVQILLNDTAVAPAAGDCRRRSVANSCCSASTSPSAFSR